VNRFPIDAPRRKVVKALQLLGFEIVREHEHVAMLRQNDDGSRTPLTLPSHSYVKASTLRTICTRASIPRDDFLAAYEKV